jgi:hypothetical protein
VVALVFYWHLEESWVASDFKHQVDIMEADSIIASIAPEFMIIFFIVEL